MQGTNALRFRDDMYQLAEAYYQTGDYSNAVSALKNVASTTDKLGQAGQMLLGQSYLKLNDTQNAVMAFDAAARSGFDSAISEEALYNYVMIRSNRDGGSAFGEAITASQQFLTEYPRSKYTDEVNSVLATTLLASKNYSTALAAINSIKSLEQTDIGCQAGYPISIGVCRILLTANMTWPPVISMLRSIWAATIQKRETKLTSGVVKLLTETETIKRHPVILIRIWLNRLLPVKTMRWLFIIWVIPAFKQRITAKP